MQERLRRLDADAVQAAIGELAGTRAIKPLLQRRDRILEISSGGAK
jgi:hypothetical protein